MSRVAYIVVLLLSSAGSVIAQVPSPNCSKVVPGVGVLVGPDGASWEISAQNDTMRDGSVFSNGKATLLEVSSGRLYVLGTDGRWYGMTANGSSWVALFDQTDPCAGAAPPASAGDCQPPLGRLAPSIFVTDWAATTGRPGSRARVNFQLASPNSPIVAIAVKLVSDADQSTLTSSTLVGGVDLTATAGLWFTTPLFNGKYRLTVYVKNAAGCELTTGATRTITVTGGVDVPPPPPPPPTGDVTVTVEWDLVVGGSASDPQIVGYEVGRGTVPSSYDVVVPIANVTRTSVQGLSSSVVYFFAVRAVNENGQKSQWSNEVACCR